MEADKDWQASQQQCNCIRVVITAAWLVLAGAVEPVAGAAESEELSALSLKELGSLQVTSVSKSPELLREAPAAIYVITQDEIQRSGVTSLAEALRLAPNVRITQAGSSNYVLSARGLSGNPDVQNFSNKMLLLIDGRSVYSPLFSGIYLDTQEVMLSDINRIEVISGPGATLWGANAVNGVVNVITNPAYVTDGASAAARGGNQERGMSARYGAKSGDAAYRVYARAFERDAASLADEDSAGDSWERVQAGFRLDINQPSGTATVQGDVYDGSNERAGPGSQNTSGANLLGRWQRHTGHSEFQTQAYFDHVQRGAPADGARFQVNTFDLEAQQSLRYGGRHQLVWGAGGRFSSYHISNTATLLFLPEERDLQLWNVFAQDTVSLGSAVKLTLGVKFEHNTFSNWEPQPDLRIAWQANDAAMLWAAVSRAIRAPTPFDVDVVERVNGMDFLVGNPDFQAENVITYETGFRTSITPTFLLSLSTFYNRYNDLRTIELDDSTGFLPLRWGNGMEGHTYGATAWAKWQVTDRWRIEPGFTLLRKHLRFKPGASALAGIGQSGNDPRGTALLNSALDLGNNQTFDISLRHVARLPEPALPAYTELSARYAWRVSNEWEVSLRGTNLLHSRHQEYPSPAGMFIHRSVLAEVRWRP
jgi:iron complex outermembrane recepter protein